MVIDAEGLVRRTGEAGLPSILYQPSVEVASHAVVAARIGAIGGDINFDDVFALDMVVVLGGCARHGVSRQHNDAVVAGADADFVLSTDHAVRLHAAQFALLDGEGGIALIEFRAEGGDDDLLPCPYVGRAADNLHRLSPVAQVNGSDVHVVAIGMGLAGQHFADDDASKSALDGFHFFHTAHFQSDGR